MKQLALFYGCLSAAGVATGFGLVGVANNTAIAMVGCCAILVFGPITLYFMRMLSKNP